MTRGLKGVYELSEEDVFRRFPDSVGLISDWRRRGPVYEIPFSSLHGSKCRNLAAAGRCVSAKGDMWDIMRVIPPCAVTGEAAGLAASISTDFRHIDMDLLQHKLRNNQVKLHIDEI